MDAFGGHFHPEVVEFGVSLWSRPSTEPTLVKHADTASFIKFVFWLHFLKIFSPCFLYLE